MWEESGYSLDTNSKCITVPSGLVSDQCWNSFVDVLPKCLSMEQLCAHTLHAPSQRIKQLAVALPLCQMLVRLTFVYAGLSTKSMCEIANVLPLCVSLDRLDLSGNPGIGNDGVNALAAILPRCKSLQRLLLR